MSAPIKINSGAATKGYVRNTPKAWTPNMGKTRGPSTKKPKIKGKEASAKATGIPDIIAMIMSANIMNAKISGVIALPPHLLDGANELCDTLQEQEEKSHWN
jgi:hypothetical protein